jgi:hypothetical protein
MYLKEALFKKCEKFIDHRLLIIQNTINEIQKSLLTETKSSAGDKHETGRAMLQLEREKAGKQLLEIQKTKEILSKIDPKNTSELVCLGVVVYTSASNYYLAISAGKIKVEDEPFYAISAGTPIGKLLLSKTVGETIVFGGQKIMIEKIL